MTDELLIEYDPYFAGLEGKTPEQKRVLENRIEQLSEQEKDFLFDSQTSDRIQEIVEGSTVGEDYAVAISKIVFLVLLGDVSPGNIQQLLEKIDIGQEDARDIAKKLGALLAPVLTARASSGAQLSSPGRTGGQSSQSAPKKKEAGLREIPPLSHAPAETEPVKAPSSNSEQTPGNGSRQSESRTIIDLRKKQGE